MREESKLRERMRDKESNRDDNEQKGQMPWPSGPINASSEIMGATHVSVGDHPNPRSTHALGHSFPLLYARIRVV